MFDFDKIRPKSEFTYWFERNDTSSEFSVIYDGRVCDTISYETTDDAEAISEEIISDWFEYMKRPEYSLGKHIPETFLDKAPIDAARQSVLKLGLEKKIVACCLSIYPEENAIKYAARALKWLETTDFYTAPASSIYHDSDYAGLLRHTLKVVNRLLELSQLTPFKSVNLAEAVLAAICHDWCKINFYELYQKNQRNPETHLWEKVDAYKCKGSEYPFGHGVTSMFMAEKLFKLSVEQALAIRWHMSIYDVSDNQKHDLFDANEKYPMVMLLQMADQLAIL